MKLTERQISEIEYRIFTCEFRGESGPSAVVLKFTGSYRHGSSGTGDGMLMGAITNYALEYFLGDVDAVLFDLRELDYEWGNNISDMWEAADSYEIPYTVVISDRCRRGFGPANNNAGSRVFDNFELALQNTRTQAEGQLDRLRKELDAED